MNAVTQMRESKGLAADKDWWRGAVIYQIYPRSFQDSNGDGVGDLLGIVERLPYVASLGVDAIWISPFFTSPMKDFGYDVSDYCDVDPMFGTLADFESLVEAAHALGLRVMIDLVLSHTSDQHPWFAESRKSRDNSKSDWYVWSDPKLDGTPPNNWLSIFGGSAWQWDGRREQYYLHNFLSEQPDLNFHNSDVQDALLEVTRFWLGLGVDGFRLDTINFYVHDAHLRDNPALTPEQRNGSIAPSVNPYNHQEHLYSKNRPENLEFLKKFRAVMEEYPAHRSRGRKLAMHCADLRSLGQYTSGDDKMQMCYAFEFLSGDSLTAARVAEVMDRIAEAASDGWACWAFSNHDVKRHATRWSLTPQAQRGMITLLMTLRGSVCIYQGEELGLPEADVAFEDLQDPYGIEFWPEFKGRDGCRTPMVWVSDNQNGGFSDHRPWLPVPSAHLGQAVSAQEHAPEALLHHYRRAIAFRRTHPVLAKGALENMKVEGDMLSFERSSGNERLFVALNMSDGPGVVDLPDGNWVNVGGRTGLGLARTGRARTSRAVAAVPGN